MRRGAEEAFDRLAAWAKEDVTLLVPEFDGHFALSPASALFRRVLVDGEYEPRIVAAVRQYLDPARDFLDIGANVGFFTVLAAKLLRHGRVLAVEPSRAAGARLKRNLNLNGVSEKVILFEGLVLDHNGSQVLNVIPGREEYSSVGALVHPSVIGQPFVRETAPATTLDDLVGVNQLVPGLIKIDVEGAEALVFAGAINTLTTHRPVIISELSDALLSKMGSSGAQIVSRLESLGYRVVDLSKPKVRAGSRPFGDILAIPTERMSSEGLR